jgi:hypothetical protein
MTHYLKTFWGPRLTFEVTQGDDRKDSSLTPKAVTEQIHRTLEEDVRQQVLNHPLVQTTQKIFKTQIKSIKETQS